MWAGSGESNAVSFGRWQRRGELKSGQLYGNELWRGSAATNRNVESSAWEDSRERSTVNFGSDRISSQAF